MAALERLPGGPQHRPVASPPGGPCTFVEVDIVQGLHDGVVGQELNRQQQQLTLPYCFERNTGRYGSQSKDRNISVDGKALA